MGTCQCTQKDIEQAKISNVNVDDLNTNTNSKNYKKQQTVQTNLDNDKSQSKYSPLSPKRELNELQNMTLKQISPSKIKNRNNINIILLGGASVGKSSFLIKLTESTFEKLYIPTICRDIRSKVISYNTHNFKFHFKPLAAPIKQRGRSIWTGVPYDGSIKGLQRDTTIRNLCCCRTP